MLALLLFAQVAASVVDTATYSTAALRALIVDAARYNRDVPAALGGYRAKVESEISIGLLDPSGRELAVSVEQVAGEMTFDRSGAFEQHITGYRSPRMGFAAFMGFFRASWVTPTLYGGRIRFSLLTSLPGRGDSVSRKAAARRDSTPPLHVVHPLADDRERYYRFTGGDTAQTVTVGNRAIRIARVEVRPRDSLPARSVVFGGEIDLDVGRKHVVRVRGAFYIVRQTAPKGGGLVPAPGATLAPGIEVLQFVELVNSEVSREFWLPQYQRVEMQLAVPVLGEGKYVYRIVSHMRDFEISAPDSVSRDADTLAMRRSVLTFAPKDSLGAYREWERTFGSATSSVSAEDLREVGPMRWRNTGPTVFTVQAEHASDMVRFNRIEGVFTGLGAKLRFRDAAPGLTLRAAAGYAWSERALRGRVSAELERDRWTYAVRGGRSLDITNDFRNSLDSGGSLSAVFGDDRNDYVDRYSVGVAAQRWLGKGTTRARVELGWADDRATFNHREKGLIGKDIFLPNRGIDSGSYTRTAVTLEWNVKALTASAWPGIGAALSYVRGDGELNFQRTELQVNARRIAGPWTFSADIHAGVVRGSPPPQQLFEITVDDYKDIAGDQAARFGAGVRFRTNIRPSPIVLLEKRGRTPRLVIPGFAPELSVRATNAWTGASNDAARAAIARLGVRALSDTAAIVYAPVSVPSNRMRTTVITALTFFGGLIGVSASRETDRRAEWRFRIGVGG